jgi:pilus assembly protein Flp/PilA
MLRINLAISNLGHAAFAKLRRLSSELSGVTAIEYGLIAGLIAVAIIAIVSTVGTDLSKVFQSVATSLL